MSNQILSLYQVRAKRQRRKRLVRFIMALSVLIVAGYFSYNYLLHNQAKKELSSPIPANKPVSKTLPNSSGQVAGLSSSGLKVIVETTLQGTKGNYGIVIKNLKTNESYYSNEHRKFDAGSLYKLWIMALTYQWIDEGTLKEDQTLSQSVETLNKKFDIDPELAEQKEGRITFTVKSALTQMITISHNYAALLLTEKLRLSAVANFLVQNKFDESSVGVNGAAPRTTAYDIALLLEKLYKGSLESKESNQKMLDLLKAQKLNGKLPKYLPDSVDIAHKTGEIGYYSHDAGIVYTPKGDYIIVILSETNYPVGAEERIANVSKAVYSYFSQQ